MASVKLYAKARDTDKTGYVSVYLKLIHERETMFIPLHIKVRTADFDFDALTCSRNHPSYLSYNAKLSAKLAAAREALLKLSDTKYTPEGLKSYVTVMLRDNASSMTLKEVLNERMEILRRENREGYARSLSDFVALFCTWHDPKTEDIYLSEITYSVLEQYKTHLIESKKATNTISAYLRGIRHIYKYALDKEYIKVARTPFVTGLVPGPVRSRKKKAAPHVIPELEKLRRSSIGYRRMAIDMILMQFYFQGADIRDIAQLPPEIGEYYTFRRDKTRSRSNQPDITVRIHEKAREIITERFRHAPTLFPLWDNANTYTLRESRIDNLARELRNNVSKLAGAHITLKTMRHTWSTIAGNIGVPIDIREMAMGHVDSGMNIGYTDYDQRLIDHANYLTTIKYFEDEQTAFRTDDIGKDRVPQKRTSTVGRVPDKGAH